MGRKLYIYIVINTIIRFHQQKIKPFELDSLKYTQQAKNVPYFETKKTKPHGKNTKPQNVLRSWRRQGIIFGPIHDFFNDVTSMTCRRVGGRFFAYAFDPCPNVSYLWRAGCKFVNYPWIRHGEWDFSFEKKLWWHYSCLGMQWSLLYSVVLENRREATTCVC